jgi:hypothetical protein
MTNSLERSRIGDTQALSSNPLPLPVFPGLGAAPAEAGNERTTDPS